MVMQQTLRSFILAVAGAVLLSCGGEQSEQIASQNNKVPDEVISDFTTEETDSGRVKWKLTAPTANKFNAAKVLLMDKPKIEFFDELGMLQTTLTADKGEYSQVTRDMLAYGNVVVVSTDGDVLETDSLRYLNAEDKIVSDSAVKLTRGDDVLTGIGLECDHNLSSVDIKRNVEARIIDDGETLDG